MGCDQSQPLAPTPILSVNRFHYDSVQRRLSVVRGLYTDDLDDMSKVKISIVTNALIRVFLESNVLSEYCNNRLRKLLTTLEDVAIPCLNGPPDHPVTLRYAHYQACKDRWQRHTINHLVRHMFTAMCPKQLEQQLELRFDLIGSLAAKFNISNYYRWTGKFYRTREPKHKTGAPTKSDREKTRFITRAYLLHQQASRTPKPWTHYLNQKRGKD